jgi:hypothetical protein
MSGITEFIDIGTGIGSGTSVGVGDIFNPVDQTDCDICDEVIQGEIICNLNDAWNNNLCSNDSCYYTPVVLGDCLNFQFQFQNTRNAKNAISYTNYLQRTTPKIKYNWFHNTLNPTDWTIKAKLFDASTGAEFKVAGNNYADTMMEQAGIFLSLDRKASAKTLPLNSFYRWTQNARFCVPSTLPNGFPSQFYFTFEVVDFTGASSDTVYTQLYQIEKCDNTILLGGLYTNKDCFGYDYAIPPDNTVTPKQSPFTQVIGSAFLYNNRPSQYNNTHRVRGTSNYVGRLIEKDIPERQCLSIKTSVKEQYDLRIKPVPPYIAEIINNALSGQVAYITGVPNYGTIEVQPNGGAIKNNDVSNMWVVDLVLNGCECLDYHQC